MKASLYIKELKKLIDEYGDLEVCVGEFDHEINDNVIIPCMPVFGYQCFANGLNCFGSVPDEEE